jgi:heme exporter protein C
LHQGASISMTAAPKMASIMLHGMLIMMAAAWMYSIAVVLTRVRHIIRERERQTVWLRELQVEEATA